MESIDAQSELGDPAVEQIDEASELTSLKDINAKLKSQLAYCQADFDNYKKRCQREKEDLVSSASESLANDIFPIIDSFEMAQETFKSTGWECDAKVMSGITMVMQQLTGALENHGFKKADVAIGSKFDVNLCEAVQSEESSQDPGTVTRIFCSGWLHNGKLVRPAKVAVAK